MRKGLTLVLSFAVAGGIAACAGDDDAELEDFETEPISQPAAEAPATTAPAALFTSDFEAAEAAPEGTQINGIVRVFAEDGMGTMTPATPAAGEEATATEGEMSATAADAGQGFRVEVELTGLGQGDHAWHIHDAPCGEQGQVVVAFTQTSDQEGIAQPLTATGQGEQVRGSATIPSDQLTLDQLRSGQYSVHVHQQGGVDHGPTLACANLTGEGDATM